MFKKGKTALAVISAFLFLLSGCGNSVQTVKTESASSSGSSALNSSAAASLSSASLAADSLAVASQNSSSAVLPGSSVISSISKPRVSSAVTSRRAASSSKPRASSAASSSRAAPSSYTLDASSASSILYWVNGYEKKITGKNDIETLVTCVKSMTKSEKNPTESDLQREGEEAFIVINGKNPLDISIHSDMIVIDDHYYKITPSDYKKLTDIYKAMNYPEVKDIRTAKPVIYLYPTVKQDITVKLHYKGQLLNTYPLYNNGWQVTAYPDGSLINKQDGQPYSYLFWDGTTAFNSWDYSKGFVVKGSDSAAFLQKTLSKMGLTSREYNEFIVYWMPELSKNEYNLITFQTTAYENLAGLDISPKPDSMLRVFMVYKPLDKPVSITAPQIKPFVRKGFTVVEWGGSKA